MTPSSSPVATRFSFRHNTRLMGDLAGQLAVYTRMKEQRTHEPDCTLS